MLKVIGFGLAWGAMAPNAWADTHAECIEANELAQAAQMEGHLIQARDIYAHCARDACPRLIRNDCAEALAGLERIIPTFSLRAKDPSGAPVHDVKISVDGTLVSKHDGVAVDPGVHWLRFETPEWGAKELRVVAVEGEKDRKIAVSFASKTPSSAKPPKAPVTTPSPAEDKGIPLGAWITAGVGLAAVGAGGYMYVSGMNQHDDGLNGACGTAQQCEDEKDSIRTKLLIGDVLTGIGLVGITSGVIWGLSAKGREDQGQASFTVTPTPRGAAARASFTF